jgi:hypothetical protein
MSDIFKEFLAEIEAIKKASSVSQAEQIEKKIINKVKMGRPKGTKNFKGRTFNEKDLTRLFGGIGAVEIGSVTRQSYKTVEDIAKSLLDRVVADASYFDYTGNLTGSFNAAVVKDRKVINRFFYNEKVKYGIVAYGRKGGRFTKRRSLTLHKQPAESKYKRRSKYIRYLRKWEKERGGYGPRNIHSPKRKPGFGESPRLNIGNFQRGSGKDIRSGIVIFNDAPYASAVHRSRGRRVFVNAGTINSIKGMWGPRYESLVRVASITALRKAGFKI